MASFYDFSATTPNGRVQPMSDYAGKVVLAVNVASLCGYTPQYAGLEQLWRTYRDRGLVVLGFPCNQFGNQEPGLIAEIAAFCATSYDVTFPIFDKVEVNGKNASPLYKWLKRSAPGLLGLQPIGWNFTKFLVDRSGNKVKRFDSKVEPEALAHDIEALLGPKAAT